MSKQPLFRPTNIFRRFEVIKRLKRTFLLCFHPNANAVTGGQSQLKRQKFIVQLLLYTRNTEARDAAADGNVPTGFHSVEICWCGRHRATLTSTQVHWVIVLLSLIYNSLATSFFFAKLKRKVKFWMRFCYAFADW